MFKIQDYLVFNFDIGFGWQMLTFGRNIASDKKSAEIRRNTLSIRRNTQAKTLAPTMEELPLKSASSVSSSFTVWKPNALALGGKTALVNETKPLGKTFDFWSQIVV